MLNACQYRKPLALWTSSFEIHEEVMLQGLRTPGASSLQCFSHVHPALLDPWLQNAKWMDLCFTMQNA